MEKIPGAQFLGEVHPVGAHNKTLISDTAAVCLQTKAIFHYLCGF